MKIKTKTTKKIITVLLCFAFIMSVMPAISGGAVIANDFGSGLNLNAGGLLVLGDSISTGYGLGNPDADSYGAVLSEAFGLTGSAYANLAVDGATSGDLAASLKKAPASSPVFTHDIIIISIGGNDILGAFFAMAKQALGLPSNASNLDLQNAITANPTAAISVGMAVFSNQTKFNEAAAAFPDNLSAIISAVKAANPKAGLYIQTIYNPFSGMPEMEAFVSIADNIIIQMNKAISNGAANGGYTVVDIYSAFKNKSLFYTNIAKFDIHPNKDGHALIAEKLKDIINYKVPVSIYKVGEAIGDVLYSDITAYINGHAIPSSIINGRTLVVAEDLAKYGFDVVWNSKEKTLKVELNKNKAFKPIATEKDTKNKPGTFKEKYVYTDIKTYLSGKVVDSFAINGVTLIDFDSLGKYGDFSWDGKTREIRLVIK